MLTIFHRPETKTFYLESFLARKKKLSPQESLHNMEILSQEGKKLSASDKGKPDTQKHFLDAPTSMEDAITYSVHIQCIFSALQCN
jgi:hypothetical protein